MGCARAHAQRHPTGDYTGYTVPNGFLKVYQISTQSAKPLPSYSKKVFLDPICGAPRAAVVTHMTWYNYHRQERRSDTFRKDRMPIGLTVQEL